MPVAKVQLPDGRIARFDVPEGTTPDQVMQEVGRMFGAEQPAAPEQPSLEWSDVAGQALKNVPSSAKQFATDLAQIFVHPVDTIKAVGNLGLGIIQKAVPGTQESEKYADAVGRFLIDRYGGEEELKRTIAADPIGFASDVSMILTGGATVAVRAPGMAGQVARATGTVGRAIDPLNIATQAVGKAAPYVGKAAAAVPGLMSGVGPRAFMEAAEAGAEGGMKAERFREAISGTGDIQRVVEDAKAALDTMRGERRAAYRAGMANVSKDKTILDFAPIDTALNNLEGVKKYKGVDLSKSTAGVRGEIRTAIDDWKALDPAEYHTPEGLDALKQMIGDIRESTEYGTPSRMMADQAYNAIKSEIVKQAPEYSKVMRGYETASENVREIKDALSLGNKSSAETALRKLQSTMRNDVSTNYGQRTRMMEQIEQSGAPYLGAELAGHALQPLAPRGLSRAVAAGAGAGAFVNPTVLFSAPLMSPRLMGEAAYYGGKGASAVAGGGRFASELLGRAGMTPRGVGVGAYQAGRLSRALQEE